MFGKREDKDEEKRGDRSREVKQCPRKCGEDSCAGSERVEGAKNIVPEEAESEAGHK